MSRNEFSRRPVIKRVKLPLRKPMSHNPTKNWLRFSVTNDNDVTSFLRVWLMCLPIRTDKCSYAFSRTFSFASAANRLRRRNSQYTPPKTMNGNPIPAIGAGAPRLGLVALGFFLESVLDRFVIETSPQVFYDEVIIIPLRCSLITGPLGGLNYAFWLI